MMNWREIAACRGMDGELFFPAAESGLAYDTQVAAAKDVCTGCPVVAECLAYALETGVTGVWGGTDTDERRALRRALRRAS